jgi:hypothetical protein
MTAFAVAKLSNVAGVATPRLAALPARGMRLVAVAPRVGRGDRAVFRVSPSPVPARLHPSVLSPPSPRLAIDQPLQ